MWYLHVCVNETTCIRLRIWFNDSHTFKEIGEIPIEQSTDEQSSHPST